MNHIKFNKQTCPVRTFFFAGSITDTHTQCNPVEDLQGKIAS